jgi:cytidine deaminase
MKRERILLEYDSFENEDQLPAESRELLQKAIDSLKQAYAPYSHFQVSAAIRLANGQILCGTNQENAAYPSGLCAERTVLFYAGSAYPGIAIEEILVLARKEGGDELLPACPCGACRQVMQENESRQQHPIRLIFRQEKTGFIRLDSVSMALPFRFDPASLT